MGTFSDRAPDGGAGITQSVPAWRLGPLMLSARARPGRTTQQLAEVMGVSNYQITQWESGKVPVLDRHLEEYALALDTSVNEIIPRRVRVTFDAETRTLSVGANLIPVPADAANKDMLRLYLDNVIAQRATTGDAPVVLRRGDIVALAAMLDTEDLELEAQLRQMMNLTATQSANVKARLTRQRVMAAAAALTIGAVGAVGYLQMQPAAAVGAPGPLVRTPDIQQRTSGTTQPNIGTALLIERETPGGMITETLRQP